MAVFALGAAALLLVAIARAYTGPVPWTSWALPLMIMANVGVLRLGMSRRAPRAAMALQGGLFAVALAILASLISSNGHRFN
jgi:hypothetical protein